MKHLWFIMIAILCLTTAASAVTYTTQGAGETDLGPSGVLVPLGIPADYLYIYTWISLGFLFLIAGTASQRNGEFWAILLPIFAAMFVWFGWLKLLTPEAQAQEWGIVLMCGVLAFAVYMKGKQQEKFGIAGPGSPFLNLVFWMVIIQASMGFINATGLFGGTGNSAATPLQYQNVDLTTTVPHLAQTGGFFDTITSDLYLMGAAAWSAATMIWKVLMAVVYFKGLVISIAPFLNDVAIVDAFLNVFTVAIDFMIMIAVWIWLFKPPVGESI
jgi:hypothetical protein